MLLYNDVTSVAFSLVVDRDVAFKGHRWRQIHFKSRQQSSFIMSQKNVNKFTTILSFSGSSLQHWSIVLEIYAHKLRVRAPRI